jgi:hypothetical protein
MAGIGSAGSSGSPMGSSPPEVGGANTFSSLKSLFKPQYATCKHCGKQFTPKSGINNSSDKQKQAIAIAASKGPKI